jgi:hypothetical protein
MCRWPLPGQSFSGLSPLGLAPVFYCLRFETSLFIASNNSQGHGGGIRPRLHTGYCPVNADGLEDNSYTRTPRNTVALLLRVCLPSRCIAMVTARTTQKTSYVITSQRLHWRCDCCLETSNNTRNSIVVCVYSVVRCLPLRYLATHVTICSKTVGQ